MNSTHSYPIVWFFLLILVEKWSSDIIAHYDIFITIIWIQERTCWRTPFHLCRETNQNNEMIPYHEGVIGVSLKCCENIFPDVKLFFQLSPYLRITWKRIVCESSILQYILTFYLNAGSIFSCASGSAKWYRVMLVTTAKLSSIGPI